MNPKYHQYQAPETPEQTPRKDENRHHIFEYSSPVSILGLNFAMLLGIFGSKEARCASMFARMVLFITQPGKWASGSGGGGGTNPLLGLCLLAK